LHSSETIMFFVKICWLSNNSPLIFTIIAVFLIQFFGKNTHWWVPISTIWFLNSLCLYAFALGLQRIFFKFYYCWHCRCCCCFLVDLSVILGVVIAIIILSAIALTICFFVRYDLIFFCFKSDWLVIIKIRDSWRPMIYSN